MHRPIDIPKDRVAGIFNEIPADTNVAYASNYRLFIPKVRLGVYFCTEVTFPGWECPPVRLPVPFAPSLKFWGNKVSHGEMSLKFIVNEDYSNYNQMSDWFKNSLVWEDFFKTGNDLQLLSNTGHLLILSGKKNPIAKFKIDGLMITGLSSIEYNSALTDASATTATATLQFSTYELEEVVNG
jgi:hypothetical protein